MKYYSFNEENIGRIGSVTRFYKINYKINEGWVLAIYFPHPRLRKKPFYTLEKFSVTGTLLNRKEIPKRKFYKVLRSVVASKIIRK